jgi:hypothetical protein
MSLAVADPPVTSAERERRREACNGLADAWDTFARGGPLCPPGCVCVRGPSALIGPADVEADVLAFLEARFAADAALAPLIARRALESAWGGAPFAAWLRALGDVALSSEAFDALTDSLSTVFQSLGGAEPVPPSRFTCT